MSPKQKMLSIASLENNLFQIEEYVEEICDEYNINTNYYGNILLVLTEAVKNAIIHGNKNDINKFVNIYFESKPFGLSFIVSDEGDGFDYNSIKDPTDPQNDSIRKADNVAEKLRKNGIEAMAIHGKKSQNSRTESLRRFKTGKINVLVASDLLSRGIDIEFLPCVINYELPRSPKDYIHRIGRTGRAESPGEAISFVTPEDKAHFRVIQKKMGKWVTMIDSNSILDL